MKYLLLILLTCSCTFKNKDRNINAEKTNNSEIINENIEQQDYMVLAFEEMMKTTSFTAIIEHYKIESFPIEDLDKNDEFAEKKLLFYANVIEVFKGENKKEIVYEMIVEINEEEILNKEPVMICLCKKNNTFYWPGTGSLFPNKQKIIDKANEIKSVTKENKINTSCFDD
jgi:hypothetical protein